MCRVCVGFPRFPSLLPGFPFSAFLPISAFLADVSCFVIVVVVQARNNDPVVNPLPVGFDTVTDPPIVSQWQPPRLPSVPVIDVVFNESGPWTNQSALVARLVANPASVWSSCHPAAVVGASHATS